VNNHEVRTSRWVTNVKKNQLRLYTHDLKTMTPGALHSKLQRFLTSTFLTQTFYKLLHKHTACSTKHTACSTKHTACSTKHTACGTKHRNANSVQIVINLDRCIAFCRITNICLPSFLPPCHPPPNPFSFPPTLLSILRVFSSHVLCWPCLSSSG
jgi:hypothetical protein